LRTKNSTLRILIIVFVTLLASSCFDKGDCLINNSNLIKINFKKKTDNTPLDVAFSSITVEGTSIVLYQSKTVKTIQLPVDVTKTSTTFILNFGGAQQKITFTYKNETIIPSVDCGAFVYQTDVKISESTFDPTSLRLVNNQLLKNTDTNFVNFEILL
jgi:hypothetical protein